MMEDDGRAPSGFDPSRIDFSLWLEVGAEQPNASALLYLGESIPDLPYLTVGQRISGDEAEELGYREFAKYGAWLIWSERGDDWHCIDYDAPKAWLPLYAIAMEARQDGEAATARAEGIAQTPPQYPSGNL